MTKTDFQTKELADLLSHSDPKELRKTIQFLYFSFTMDKDNKHLLPENFDQMSADIFHLLEFFDHIEVSKG